MGKKKSKLQSLFGARITAAKRMPMNPKKADSTRIEAAPVSSVPGADSIAAPCAGLERPVPRQRGRPRKNPLGPEVTVKREESVNNTNAIVKVLLRSLKDHNKPMATANNGFARGLKPDTIVAGFRHEGQLMFAVKFKNRKLPELISSMELKLRAPSLLIQYYVTNLQYPHHECN
ncbi:uncharacterized protein LOC111594252 [Drosophila hydei]|uniref:Uncharacterized protein LOC111594252 n=1 Tax=Drosophila hydei TaxID=7224 RepID=A0A6J1LB43_DROHY|nr:uncharacterized protein LOC111594252 [Drosophila hydei]